MVAMMLHYCTTKDLVKATGVSLGWRSGASSSHLYKRVLLTEKVVNRRITDEVISKIIRLAAGESSTAPQRWFTPFTTRFDDAADPRFAITTRAIRPS